MAARGQDTVGLLGDKGMKKLFRERVSREAELIFCMLWKTLDRCSCLNCFFQGMMLGKLNQTEMIKDEILKLIIGNKKASH